MYQQVGRHGGHKATVGVIQGAIRVPSKDRHDASKKGGLASC